MISVLEGIGRVFYIMTGVLATLSIFLIILVGIWIRVDSYIENKKRRHHN